MCIAKQSDEELQEYMQFELAPFPLSLFTEEGMRKGTKSWLYKVFMPLSNDTLFGNSTHVIDGGFLLHRVVWHHNQSFAAICTNYVQYVERHYGLNAVIVFDGYPANAANKNTKSAERLRRSTKQTSADVLFDESMIATFTQASFLANETNKSRLISMLKKRFEASNFTVQQAAEDADTMIVRTAINMASSFDSVFIVGEDIDLLVLLTALARAHPNVYFLKPGKGKTAQVVFSSQSLQGGEAVVDNVLFLHAFSGCDTTSAIFGQGKIKFFNVLQKSEELHRTVQVFKEVGVDSDTIAAAGEQFLATLYRARQDKTSLNFLRYQQFARSVTKSKFNPASLPPTTAAARQHSLRTYHQVQAWYGINMNPEQWGWERSKTGLTPVKTTEDPAPEALLKFISCSCRKGCGRACGCRKAGLKCSIICMHCNGDCENMTEVLSDSEEAEEETQTAMDQFFTTQDGEEEEDTEEAAEEEDIEEDDDTQPSPEIDINQPGPSRASKRQKIA